MSTEAQIKSDIHDFIRKGGGAYKEWYVGVTSDPEKRLFEEHNVDKAKDLWIYRTADSASIARSVEQYFIDLGCDGGPGGGDYTAKVVYAYKKSWRTKP